MCPQQGAGGQRGHAARRTSAPRWHQWISLYFSHSSCVSNFLSFRQTSRISEECLNYHRIPKEMSVSFVSHPHLVLFPGKASPSGSSKLRISSGCYLDRQNQRGVTPIQSTQREDKVVQPIQRPQLVPGGLRQTATELESRRKPAVLRGRVPDFTAFLHACWSWSLAGALTLRSRGARV